MRSRPGGAMIGRVIEINWRATRLLTKTDEIIVIPNSEMARTKFINYSIPERYYRDEVQVSLSHTVAPERAKRILMAALLSTPGIMKEPEPQVILLKFNRAASCGVSGFGSATMGKTLRSRKSCTKPF